MIKRRTASYKITHVVPNSEIVKPKPDKPMTKADKAVLILFIFSVIYFVVGVMK